MSADYCRATNRILSKRAERDLNTFPLAWCCNSWMLGNNFQPSFPSLHSPGSFILKQVKNLRQSDLCSNWGRSLRSQTSAYICTQSAGPAPLDTESCFFCFFFFFSPFATLSMQWSLQGRSASCLRINQRRRKKASAILQPL